MKLGVGKYIRTVDVLRKMSEVQRGKHHTEESKRKIAAFRLGRVESSVTRRKCSEWQKGKPKPATSGDRNHLWRGGITPINRAIRNSLVYRLWREAVFIRDDYRCLDCGTRGGRLNADHIYPFALFPRLRLMLENGRTLCEECHKLTPTFGGRSRKHD